MSRTIGHHLPLPAHGDHQARCDICGVVWMRSRLWRDASGVLRCPDDGDGKDAITLDRNNIALTPKRRPKVRTDGAYAKEPIEPPVFDKSTLVPAGKILPSW